MIKSKTFKRTLLAAGIGLLVASPSILASTLSAQLSAAIHHHNIPNPVGISSTLESVIDKRQVGEAMPATPESTEEWLKAVKFANKEPAQLALKAAKELDVSVEKNSIAGVETFVVTPATINPRYADHYFMHLHSGAFVFGGEEAALREAIWMANGLGVKVISVDYRKPPLHPFPAAIDDAVAVWKDITSKQEASKTVIFGTSAGGNLTLTTTLRLKEQGLPMPGALFAGTPATDLAHTSDSWLTLEGLDPLGRRAGLLQSTFDLYAANNNLENPLISPVYGELNNFPPTLLISGTRDLLLSDTVRMHRALRAAGVSADLHIYDGQSHADYLLGLAHNLPESDDALAELNAFFNTHLN
ncbi:alpha/beta hydrolase [Agarivorans sp. MS3-6]|uniref:alpha/beta hydrolase n=1 Tax=Agarivorans sp. TSD2052 TaxID=2937286 RepID=UPI00200EF5F0|nr:alpha/beta hydrolase [Agarivorans sp. TSD2052]UPW17483.1 alpha/beta hydrolase [Agarivorans sp. TSD2052]